MSFIGHIIRGLYNRILKKLTEISAAPQSIAAGFATGVAISFTPFVGFHLLIALIITRIFQQNSVAAALGTIAGNPWTFPPIWYLTWHTGAFLSHLPSSTFPTDFIPYFKELFHALIMLDFKVFISDIWPIYYPMLVGCIPWVIMVWLCVYHILKHSLQFNQQQIKGRTNDFRNRV